MCKKNMYLDLILSIRDFVVSRDITRKKFNMQQNINMPYKLNTIISVSVTFADNRVCQFRRKISLSLEMR